MVEEWRRRKKKEEEEEKKKKEMNEDDAVSIVFIPYCDLLLNVRFSLYFLNYKIKKCKVVFLLDTS